MYTSPYAIHPKLVWGTKPTATCDAKRFYLWSPGRSGCLALLTRTPLSSSTLLSMYPSSPRTRKFPEQKGSGSESGSSWQPPYSPTRRLVCVRAQSRTKNPERSSSSGFPLTHSLPGPLQTTVLDSGEETKEDARKLAAHLTTKKNKGGWV